MPDKTMPAELTHISQAARLLEITLPGSLEEAESGLHALLEAVNRQLLEVALHVYYARFAFFESTGEWMQWAIGTYQRPERFFHYCLNAGHFLLANLDREQLRGRAVLQGGAVIEKLAELDKLEPGELDLLMRRHDIADMSRDEIRAAVKTYVDMREAIRSGNADPKDTPPPAKPKKTNRDKLAALIDSVAVMSDDELRPLVDVIDPRAGLQAARQILDVTVAHLRQDNWVSEEIYAAELPYLQSAVEQLQGLYQDTIPQVVQKDVEVVG